jgi:hypothetical protein
MNQMTEAIPVVGDLYKHSTGVYKVDWVCGCGSYEDANTCVGLCGDGMTWSGSVKQMIEEGFIKL